MARTTIPAELVAVNAIQGTLIADNSVTAVHIATNAISGTLVADNAVTSTHIAQNNVTATQIAQNTITVTQMADDAIETAKINASAVTTAKINNGAVTADKLAANSVTSANIVNGTIVAADLGDNAVTIAKMASLARGSIIYGDSAGDPAALSIGSNGTALVSDGTDISWGAAGETNRLPLTGGTLTGTLTSNSAIKTTGEVEIASSQPRLHLDRNDGSYSWNIYNGNGSGNFPNSTFNIANNAGTAVITALDNGNVGIGTTAPDTSLHVFKATAGSITDYSNNALIVENSGDVGISFHTPNANAGHLMFGSPGHQYHSYIRGQYGASTTSTLKFFTDGVNTMTHKAGKVGIGTDAPGHKVHVHGGSADTILAVSTNDGYVSEIRMMEEAAATTHGGFIRYEGNGDYLKLGHYNSGSETLGFTMKDTGHIGIGTSDPKSTLQIEGGRMGIISTDSSWEQLRIANPNVAEAGIAIMNGATNTEFLSDTLPSFSNAFTLAINPYGCGTDTLAIGHGGLGDSIWHIDGSGNFGYGPNTENPVSYYEISKTRPNVNQPSDYELKLSLNTYGYVNDNYKLAMLQWLGGDSASAQDNFYAGIGATALDGSNNSEEGSIDFHVRNGISTTETLAMQIIGKAGTGVAGSGQHGKSVLFPYQGIAIDRIWANYPGISVLNDSDHGSSLQGEFRFHGTNSSSDAYPGTSGADFSVNVRADGSFISTSDKRAKTNITTIDNALDTVKQLTGKRFQKINRENEPQEHLSKNGYKLGFIAQEVEGIIPEAVQYHADEDDGTENWNSSYAMDYASLTALLVNAIKEQDTTIQDLKSRLETLEG